jgi:hypothetical protein
MTSAEIKDQRAILAISACLQVPLVSFMIYMLIQMAKHRVNLVIVLVLIVLMSTADIFWILSQIIRLV